MSKRIEINSTWGIDPELLYRRPTAYDPQSDTLYVGEPGTLHDDLIEQVFEEDWDSLIHLKLGEERVK